MRKPKDLKQNGESNKYITVNYSGWDKFIKVLFNEKGWYYLTIKFKSEVYTINTILWEDEIDLLKLTVTFPFKYRIYNLQNRHANLEIKLDKIPDIMQDMFDKLNPGDFCEYYKRALKGY